MAKRTFIRLFDDLDGTYGEDVTTVVFGVDGVEYEIDLNEVNARRLRRELDAFLAVARRTGGRLKREVDSTSPNRVRAAEDTKAIRQWARQNGHDISERGRLPIAIINAYHSAGQTVENTRSKPRTKSAAKPKATSFSG